MRGLAAVYVLLFHVQTLLPALSTPILSVGWSGVDFFFVLSAFLFTRQYLKDPLDVRTFYIKRVFRIWPLFFIVITAITLLGWYEFSWWLYLRNVVAVFEPKVYDPLPFWTLYIEELFYLLFPLWIALFRRIPERRRIYFVAACFAVSVVWLQYFWSDQVVSARQLPAYLADYSLGTYVATLTKAPRYSRAVGVLAFVAIPFVYLPVPDPADHYALVPTLMHTMSFAAPLYSVVYALLLVGFIDLKALLNRVLVFLGDISYGLYIWQLPLLFYVPLQYGVPAVFVLAAASHYLVERPFIALGRALSARVRPPRPAPARLAPT